MTAFDAAVERAIYAFGGRGASPQQQITYAFVIMVFAIASSSVTFGVTLIIAFAMMISIAHGIYRGVR